MRRHARLGSSSVYTYEWEVEGEGDECDLYTFDINYSYTPGEDPVYYDSDGSGCPGSGPEIEIEEVILITANVNSEEVDVTSELSKEWEKRFQEYIDNNWDEFYGRLADDAEVDMDGAEDAYWDRKYDEMRDEGLL